MSNLTACPTCANPVSQAAQACPKCGTALRATSSEGKSNQPGSRFPVPAAVVLLVVFFLLFKLAHHIG